jgi:ABC-type phosphate transport system substrate-binding protein
LRARRQGKLSQSAIRLTGADARIVRYRVLRTQEERNMRMLTKLVTGAAAVATVTALSAGPALADPPAHVSPAPGSVVSVGAQTTQYLSDALAATWDKAHPKKTQLYTWDAANSLGVDGNITTKKGCAKILRPNGSSPGITSLAANIKIGSHFCIDFARSSRAEKSTDPTGLSFIPLAFDSVTYASVTKGSNAPANLSTKDLTEIYTCTATKWNQVGGKSSATIHPLLAQTGSGTVSFFLAAIGVTTPGKCVDEPTTLEENQGVDPIFTGANAKNEIIPFSAGDWIAQAYHSAACLNKTCTPVKGVTCKPKKGQNAFGCDANGVLKLNNINGTKPVNGTGTSAALNPKFSSIFIRTLYNVVRTAKTKDSIPAYLEQFLGAKSLFCTNNALVKDYGFLADPACGS